MNQYGDAKVSFERALELDPSNDSYKKNLEVAEQKLAESTVMNTHHLYIHNTRKSDHVYQCFDHQTVSLFIYFFAQCCSYSMAATKILKL